MPNHLEFESSPYLLQHKDNPVHWYPWGEEALQLSKKENKPIFLSIGYSACHWCHVMEHESFENDALAEMLNKHFVSIKVDREERPDLDQIYMNAVILMNGRGGWPMSVFLTPDLGPYFGGTYWPPEPRGGMPGFGKVIEATAAAWALRRDDVLEQAEKIVASLQQFDKIGEGGEAATLEHFLATSDKLSSTFDPVHGGFGNAPKFPRPQDMAMLLRLETRQKQNKMLPMLYLTLDKMAAGGIYDHLGGGFARYAVDERWLVPHFEKMLYDNALLASSYLDGYQASRNESYSGIARETIDYVLRDMTDPAGGFYSSEDADSEGVEGKFYVWSHSEVKEILGDEAAEKFCYVYDVSKEGNFEGSNILNLPKPIEQCAKLKEWEEEELMQSLSESKQKLLAARGGRVRPGRDDKIIVSWNGLMINALAQAANVLKEPRYLEAAEKAASFILDSLSRDDGRLLHTWRSGKAKLDAYLDDYACLANGLITLYEASSKERWLEEAVRLADLMLLHFRDSAEGGFFFTADDHEKLISRHKDVQDSSIPSASGMAATLLMRLGQLRSREDYIQAARETIDAAVGLIKEAPNACGQILIALDLALGQD